MRLLIAADDKFIAAVKEPLAKRGFTVEVAQSQVEVVQACTKEPRPAVAILALKLKPGWGPTALAEVRRLLGEKAPPVAFVLPPSRTGDRDALLASGAAEAFETPIKLGAFCTRVKELGEKGNDAAALASTSDGATPSPANTAAAVAAVVAAARAPALTGAPGAAMAASPSGAAPGATDGAASVTEFPITEQPALPGGLDSKLADLSNELFGTVLWPGPPAPIEPCEAALLARVAAKPLPEGANAELVEAVFKTLTQVELKAFQAAAGVEQTEVVPAPPSAPVAEASGNGNGAAPEAAQVPAPAAPAPSAPTDVTAATPGAAPAPAPSSAAPPGNGHRPSASASAPVEAPAPAPSTGAPETASAAGPAPEQTPAAPAGPAAPAPEVKAADARPADTKPADARPPEPRAADKKTMSDKGFKIPTESAPLVTRMSAERLRVRLLLKEAERVASGTAPVTVDDAALSAFLKQIDASMEGINPAVQRAVAAGELGLVRAYNAAKQSVLNERHAMENRARKFRGEKEVQQAFGAGLDASASPEAAKRKLSGKGAAARVLYTVGAAAQALGPPKVLIWATVAIVAIGLLLHALVFDTFGIISGRKTALSVSAPSVVRVEATGQTTSVMLQPGFDVKKQQEQLRQVVKEIGTSAGPIVLQPEGGGAGAIIIGENQGMTLPFGENATSEPITLNPEEPAGAGAQQPAPTPAPTP